MKGNHHPKLLAMKGKGIKVLPLKQMLQRLQILLTQVQASNTSKKFVNNIRQIIYPLYLVKQISKKVYNNLLK